MPSPHSNLSASQASSEKIVMDKDFAMMGNSPDDARLIKKWGFISALPSEYLIHFRSGKINEPNSGQGATCFKYPSDTVFIIPTSLKEIVFQANQLTVDNVDVRVRGMAVYRIKEPLKIFKLLNFLNRSRAEEKLARMIADMCRSTVKWLIANMKLEECIRKRKEEIGDALKKEVARVVAQENGGWGIEITTIDIQDIYIQDKEIFDAMQMTFKTDKMKHSRMAQLDTEREVQFKQLEVDCYLAEQRKENQLKEAHIEAEIKDAKILLAQQSEEKQFALDKYRVEQNEQVANYKLEQGMDRDRKKMDLNLEKAQKELEAKKITDQQELDTLRGKIEIENSAQPVTLERNFIEHALPHIAKVMSENMRNMSMNIYQQDGQGATPFNFLLAQLMQVLKERIHPLQENSESGGTVIK